MLDPQDHHFRPADKDSRCWVRRLYGFETLCCHFVEDADGFAMYAGGMTVKFAVPRTRAALKGPLRAAWLRARHLAPVIACTLKRGPRGERDWIYEYTVPADATEAGQWADATIHWHDAPKTLLGMDQELEDTWWRLDGNTPNLHLHIAPAAGGEGDYQIFYFGPHCAMDARAMMPLMQFVFDCMFEKLDGKQEPTLQWGEETARLAPTMAACTGELFPPPQSEEPKVVNGSATAPAAAPPFIPFLPPLVANPEGNRPHENVTSLLKLTRAETTAYRAACKKRGRTATHLMNALLVLAELETALRWAVERGGDDVFAQTVAAYEQATHMLFVFTFINQRLRFLSEYASLIGGKGTAMLATDGTQMHFDIALLRKAIKVNKDAKTLAIEASPALAWKIVDAGYAANQAIPTDWAAFREREAKTHAQLASFSMVPMQSMRTLMTSSIGDFAHLGILDKYLPAAHAPLAVTAVHNSVRNSLPLLLPICWQFDGQINIFFHTARRWQTQERMDMFTASYRRWLDVLLAADQE